MNPIEIIQNLPKYVQALYSDGTLYFSGEKNIATKERKLMLMNDINLLKNMISSLEEMLSTSNNE
jgi:hypothetical protein